MNVSAFCSAGRCGPDEYRPVAEVSARRLGQRSCGHPRWLLDCKQLQHRRRDVAETPSWRSAKPGFVTISGTGFVEGAVFGLPSSSSTCSVLQCSAVIRHVPRDSHVSAPAAHPGARRLFVGNVTDAPRLPDARPTEPAVSRGLPLRPSGLAAVCDGGKLLIHSARSPRCRVQTRYVVWVPLDTVERARTESLYE
jgi:hypothetical protein